MKDSEKKFKKHMNAGELATLLRQLADELEGRNQDTQAPLNGAFKQFRKARLEFKNKGSRLSVKMKVESALPQTQSTIAVAKTSESAVDSGAVRRDDPAPTAALQDESKPKYKTLKKRMKSSFQHIREALADNRMPAAEIVKSFLDDSETMTHYPGYGDEHYEAFRQLCAGFATAYTGKDLEALKSLTENLNQIKSECHKRYK